MSDAEIDALLNTLVPMLVLGALGVGLLIMAATPILRALAAVWRVASLGLEVLGDITRAGEESARAWLMSRRESGPVDGTPYRDLPDTNAIVPDGTDGPRTGSLVHSYQLSEREAAILLAQLRIVRKGGSVDKLSANAIAEALGGTRGDVLKAVAEVRPAPAPRMVRSGDRIELAK